MVKKTTKKIKMEIRRIFIQTLPLLMNRIIPFIRIAIAGKDSKNLPGINVHN